MRDLKDRFSRVEAHMIKVRVACIHFLKKVIVISTGFGENYPHIASKSFLT